MMVYGNVSFVNSSLISPNDFVKAFPIGPLEVFEDQGDAEHSALKQDKTTLIYQIEIDKKTIGQLKNQVGGYFISSLLASKIMSVKVYHDDDKPLLLRNTDGELRALMNRFQAENKLELLRISETLDDTLALNDKEKLMAFVKVFDNENLKIYGSDLMCLFHIYQKYSHFTYDQALYCLGHHLPNYNEKILLIAELQKIHLFIQMKIQEKLPEMRQKLHKFITAVAKLESQYASRDDNEYCVFVKELTSCVQLIVKAFDLNEKGRSEGMHKQSVSDYQAEVRKLKSNSAYAKDIEKVTFILMALSACISPFALIKTGTVSPLSVTASPRTGLINHSLFTSGKLMSKSNLPIKESVVSTKYTKFGMLN